MEKEIEMNHLTTEESHTKEIGKYALSMIEFHKKLQPISKDSTNPHLKNAYLSLDAILSHVRPILAECGLCVQQTVAGSYISTTILHISGEYWTSRINIELWNSQKGINNLQQLGGSITYLKRYALSAMLSISADKDDDGSTPGVTPNKKKYSDDPRPWIDEKIIAIVVSSVDSHFEGKSQIAYDSADKKYKMSKANRAKLKDLLGL